MGGVTPLGTLEIEEGSEAISTHKQGEELHEAMGLVEHPPFVGEFRIAGRKRGHLQLRLFALSHSSG